MRSTHPATIPEETMRRLIGVGALAGGRGEVRRAGGAGRPGGAGRGRAARAARAAHDGTLALGAGGAHALAACIRLFTPPEILEAFNFTRTTNVIIDELRELTCRQQI